VDFGQVLKKLIFVKIRSCTPKITGYNKDMIKRERYTQQIKKALGRSPVVALLGPRQCGKTTLARLISEESKSTYFDLESQKDIRRLENPEMMLASLSGLVIIDEIQILPQLFATLRVAVDKPDNKCNLLILGSASPYIIKNVSETLAGRVEFVDLSGFDVEETGEKSSMQLWIRGGFPRSFLAKNDEDSFAWRENFIRTFLERDIPQLGIKVSSAAMRRFWTMLAHYHGQTWNASEIARSMGLSDKTVRTYLDILTETFMLRQLQPWQENLKKRQVKAPKIYFRDTGLLHNLLELGDFHSVSGHPRAGASWEGFALEQVLRIIKPSAYYYWATYSEAELDLFFLLNGKGYGVEFKYSEAPSATKSMHTAIQNLNLEKVLIVYPGKEDYPVDSKIAICPIHKVKDYL